jgi:hypothetical protein
MCAREGILSSKKSPNDLYTVFFQRLPRHNMLLGGFKPDAQSPRKLQRAATKIVENVIKLNERLPYLENLEKAGTAKVAAKWFHLCLSDIQKSDKVHDNALAAAMDSKLKGPVNWLQIDLLRACFKDDHKGALKQLHSHPKTKGVLSSNYKKIAAALEPAKGFWGKLFDFFNVAKRQRQHLYGPQWAYIKKEWATLEKELSTQLPQAT